MKRTKRITKFTIETEQSLLFRSHSSLVSSWCVECVAETQMATLAEAARVGGLTELTICELIDSRSLHFKEDAQGRVLVCLNSLLK